MNVPGGRIAVGSRSILASCCRSRTLPSSSSTTTRRRLLVVSTAVPNTSTTSTCSNWQPKEIVIVSSWIPADRRTPLSSSVTRRQNSSIASIVSVPSSSLRRNASSLASSSLTYHPFHQRQGLCSLQFVTNNNYANNRNQPKYQVRHSSSWITSYLPEAVQDFSIWGGSGYLLKIFHGDAELLPYWGGFIAISLLVRTLLIPMVIYGAKTASRFSVIVPEVQFLISLFQNDMKQLRDRHRENKTLNTWPARREQWKLLRINLATLGGIYKLHNVKPYAIFLSPLLQIPIFWYISVDLRKIVNGLDPALAQQLVDTSVGWISDLTEPDPWYGLPVFAGLIMYTNLEAAMGKRTLAGPSASKTDTAKIMKDVFQTIAVFMPCFTSQLPSGVQIYIVTSFLFTLLQSIALRNDAIREQIGLPSLSFVNPDAGKYAKQFIELKQLEQKARKIRGPNGPILGQHGILANQFEVTFPGKYRPSTIQGSIRQVGLPTTTSNADVPQRPTLTMDVLPKELQDMPFVHGITAPLIQLLEQHQISKDDDASATTSTTQPGHDQMTAFTEYNSTGSDSIPYFDDEIMEQANRGDRKHPPRSMIVDSFAASVAATPPTITTTSMAPTKLSGKRFEKKTKQAKSNKKRPK